MPAVIVRQEDGSQIIEGDYTLDEAKAKAVEHLKSLCTQSILAAAPEYRQLNAAIGVLPEQDAAAVRNAIQTRRSACNAIEAEIAASTTFEQLAACPQWSEPA